MNSSQEMTKQSTMKDNWLIPLLLALVSCPTWLTVTSSPTLLAVPAALGAIWYFSRQKHWFLAGLLTTICLFRPEYLPFVVIPGLIIGRYFYLGGLVVSSLAVFFAAQFMHQEINIPNLLAVAANGGPVNMMQNFAGFLTLLLGEGTPQLPIAIWVIYGTMIVGATELWWRMRHIPVSQPKYLKKAAITMLMMLLAAPHTYAQDYIAFIPVAIWLWLATANDARSNAATLRKLIIAFPIVSWLFYLTPATFVMLRMPPYFVWGIFLAVVLLPTIDDERVDMPKVAA